MGAMKKSRGHGSSRRGVKHEKKVEGMALLVGFRMLRRRMAKANSLVKGDFGLLVSR